MSSMLEKLAGAKALIESAIEEELARTAPPPAREQSDCKHKNSQEVTGAGRGPARRACVDCDETWEVNDGG